MRTRNKTTTTTNTNATKKIVNNYEKINGADQKLEQLITTYTEIINNNKKTYYQLKNKLKQE